MQHRTRWLISLILMVLIGLGATQMVRAGQRPPTPTPSIGHEGKTLLSALQDAYQARELDMDTYAYWLAVSVYEPDQLPAAFKHTRPEKDGTLALLLLRDMWPDLSPQVRERIQHLRNPWGTQRQSRPTLSGPEQVLLTDHFAIHYTLEGEDAISATDMDNNNLPDYVETVAQAAEHAWHVEVETLGWTPPPDDQGEGGDTRYDIYLKDMQYYGYTDPAGGFVGDNPKSPNRREQHAYYTYMVLENDYRGFTGLPVDLLRVSLAHEFNHALQFGYDGDEPAIWLYEGVATWMEDEVYDSINDNWQYLGTEQHTTNALFDRPEVCLNAQQNSQDTRPYSTWIFFRYISEHVGGPATVRGVWEQAIPYDGYDAVEHALQAQGRHLPDVFADYVVAAYLQLPCASVPDGYPYCFEEAPFRWKDHPLQMRVEGEIDWTGSPGTVRPVWGIQETAANIWRLRRRSDLPLLLKGTFPTDWHFRVRYVDHSSPPQVTDVPVTNGESILLLTGRESTTDDALIIVRTDIPNGGMCGYVTYRIQYEAGESTPTPTPSPSPTPTPTRGMPTPTPIPSPTPTPSPTPVHWPAEACADWVENGGFENSLTDPWVERGTEIIYDNREYPNVMAHSGTRAAWFGGYPNADDALYQDITLPSRADRLTLEFWTFMRTQAMDTPRHYLWARVEDLDGHVLEQAGLWHNLSPQGQWLRVRRDVTSYKGRTIRLMFQARTDASDDLTNFYVDDVALLACVRPPLVKNGGFEMGLEDWDVGGDQPVSVVTETVHSGEQAVLLGTPVPRVPQTSEAGWITQRIPVPAEMDKPTLHYWYRIFTNDIRDYSRFKVLLQDAEGKMHLLLDAGYDSPDNIPPDTPGYDMGWQEGANDLSPYRGTWVTLYFRNENTHPGTGTYASLGIWTYLDDIKVTDDAARGGEHRHMPLLLHGYTWPVPHQVWRPQPQTPWLAPLKAKVREK